MLELKDVSSGYGGLPILNDIDLAVEKGQINAVVGANGAGKTTLLRTISGLVKLSAGQLIFNGRDISNLPAHHRPGLGLVMVPEGRRLFSEMTVEENLILGSSSKRSRDGWRGRLVETYDRFPILKERRRQLAGSLSGGEQQMCAIGRGVMAVPDLLLLDEPSLGLAPIMVERVLEMIRSLAESGITVLLVEQNVHDALEMSENAFVLEQGSITMRGSGQELLKREDLKRAYLGL